VAAAEASLKQMLEVADLAGKRFLDIGCGSGLFSLAARRLGALVHSFDYDPQSVACTGELKRRYFPDDVLWTIEEGSVLDQSYLASLGQFDVVYSWGVLHHTGQMWQALDAVAPLVAEDGKLFIAIYNDRGGASRRWAAVKRFYNRSPRPVRTLLVLAIGAYFEMRAALSRLARLQNPLPFKRQKAGRVRGMSGWHDLVTGSVATRLRSPSRNRFLISIASGALCFSGSRRMAAMGVTSMCCRKRVHLQGRTDQDCLRGIPASVAVTRRCISSSTRSNLQVRFSLDLVKSPS